MPAAACIFQYHSYDPYMLLSLLLLLRVTLTLTHAAHLSPGVGPACGAQSA